MAYETRAGSGSLFPNDRKTQDNHPDWKGRIKWHNGMEAWLSGWEKETKDGRKYLSLSVGQYITPQVTKHEKDKANGYQPQNDLDSTPPF